jgi:hypothetical protein
MAKEKFLYRKQGWAERRALRLAARLNRPVYLFTTLSQHRADGMRFCVVGTSDEEAVSWLDCPEQWYFYRTACPDGSRLPHGAEWAPSIPKRCKFERLPEVERDRISTVASKLGLDIYDVMERVLRQRYLDKQADAQRGIGETDEALVK